MGSSTISPTTASTTTNDPSTTTATTTPSPPCNHLLEITLISAQDVAAITKSSKTFAVIWVHPDRKLRTSVESSRHSGPTWNDKFVFRVSDEFLESDESAVFIEIYTVSWFRNNLIGTVRIMINDLIPPSSRTEEEDFTTRIVALQVRRPSGSPEGILNMAVSLTDRTDLCIIGDGSNDLVSEKVIKSSPKEIQDNEDEQQKRLSAKIHSWPSDLDKMELDCDDSPAKGNGSVYNGSSVVTNESDLYSDVGPSASVVAAAIAQRTRTAVAKEKPISKEGRGEVDAGSKAERSLTELPPGTRECSEKRRARRRSDTLSCFVYGLEFTIVCGARDFDEDRYGESRVDDRPIKRSLVFLRDLT